ncbi:hypothetical protein [Stutzerimonas stutzeri]|uniref:hypothetical protein n=1 Tax=Stutzerimonas stutzeri TaxID=316 RepID=UPI001C771B91|nr:hypothetical protein [Stutzerimonas stutzeri]BCY01597.1 hypothetical protein PszF2a_13860 [Stutzerimonas stutzeri]
MATVNPWKRFEALLPGGQRAVGTVTTINQVSGISTIRLRNGTEITARGVDVPEGSKAFIVDGQITGPAPDLPHYDVEV